MASRNNVSNTRDEIAVHGYIRGTFAKEYMIDVIIECICRFYVIDAGSLYMFGIGSCGRLGLEKHYNSKGKMHMPTVCPPFDQLNTLEASAGYNHTLMLDIDNNVWSCGNGSQGALGNGETVICIIPTKLKLNYPVIAVSAGLHFSLILLQNGWVQSFGSNAYGQIGQGELKSSLVPKTIESLKKYKIIQISTGGRHSAVLTEDGDLFCFGMNRYGECGVGKHKGTKIKTPTRVEMDHKVAFIDCGSTHSLVITRNDMIYSFGNGNNGKLGNGSDANKSFPTVINSLQQNGIIKCAAGGFHSLCLDKKGMIWSFGANGSGQCGLAPNIFKTKMPKRMSWFGLNRIKAIDCAAGTMQSTVITEDGSLYVLGGPKSHLSPTKLPLPDHVIARKVSTGSDHSAVICN